MNYIFLNLAIHQVNRRLLHSNPTVAVIQLNILMCTQIWGALIKQEASPITHLHSSYPKELLNHSQNTNGRWEGVRGANASEGTPERADVVPGEQ